MSDIKNYSDLIDDTYPIHGKANNINGFHNNFTYIKNSLDQADSEIVNLRTNGLRLTETNTFVGGTIENVIIKKSRIVLETLS